MRNTYGPGLRSGRSWRGRAARRLRRRGWLGGRLGPAEPGPGRRSALLRVRAGGGRRLARRWPGRAVDVVGGRRRRARRASAMVLNGGLFRRELADQHAQTGVALARIPQL